MVKKSKLIRQPIVKKTDGRGRVELELEGELLRILLLERTETLTKHG